MKSKNRADANGRKKVRRTFLRLVAKLLESLAVIEVIKA